MPSRPNPVSAAIGLFAGAALLGAASIAAITAEAGPFLLADRPQLERLALLGDGVLQPGLSIQSQSRLRDDCAGITGNLQLVCENLPLDLRPRHPPAVQAPAAMQQAAL